MRPHSPRAHAFAVEVEGTDSSSGDVEREKHAEMEAHIEAEARLRLDTTVSLAPGEVLLISYDPIERRLVALAGDRPPQRARSVSPPAR